MKLFAVVTIAGAALIGWVAAMATSDSGPLVDPVVVEDLRPRAEVICRDAATVFDELNEPFYDMCLADFDDLDPGQQEGFVEDPEDD